jgi:hypothetical protein
MHVYISERLNYYDYDEEYAFRLAKGKSQNRASMQRGIRPSTNISAVLMLISLTYYIELHPA